MDNIGWQKHLNEITTVLFVKILSNDLSIICIENIFVVFTNHLLQESNSIGHVLDNPISSYTLHLNSVSFVMSFRHWNLSKTISYELIRVIMIVIILFELMMPEVLIYIRQLRRHNFNDFIIIYVFQLQYLLVCHLDCLKSSML